MNARERFAVDKMVELQVNSCRQRVRLRSCELGLPPLLVVQGGPALPLLHEVRKFERLLNLEELALVAYWEQRGCGSASAKDAKSVSMARQVEDLRTVLRWLHAETQQRVVILGISIGATFALQAAEREVESTSAVIAISPDARTAVSDEHSFTFLEEQARCGTERLSRKVKKLGPPPYLDLTAFQRRATLLADLNTIEYGRSFGSLLRETFVGMLRTYGVVGATRALRNINLILRNILPEMESLDLIANPPRLSMPVHYIFGEKDALTPASLTRALPNAIAAPGTVVRVPNGGHMVHFDHPDIVRSIVETETQRLAAASR